MRVQPCFLLENLYRFAHESDRLHLSRMSPKLHSRFNLESTTIRALLYHDSSSSDTSKPLIPRSNQLLMMPVRNLICKHVPSHMPAHVQNGGGRGSACTGWRHRRYIYIYIYIQKNRPVVRLGGLAPTRPINMQFRSQEPMAS